MLVRVLVLLAFSASQGSCLTPEEQIFVGVPNNDSAAAHLKFITAVPHVAGTPGDLRNAIYVRDELRSYGFQAELDNVSVLLSYPKDAPQLALMDAAGKTVFTASLSEEILPTDHTSDTYWRNHTFNGYAASGAADAEIVYANYGMPEDFDALEKAGVNVSGKIVLARYGQCFRGLKALNAQKRGAVAALIYSDPGDDGFTRGKTYPEGPWRPESGVQRGSVAFISLCAGDPSRAYLNKSVEEVCGFATDELTPNIPTIPLSWGDALPILQAMKGPVAPTTFQGGLGSKIQGGQYHLGPTPGKAKLSAKNDFVTTPVWNVIATMKGTLPSDQDR
jgi:N-acetylated-alpha-linked acidic dipeptidase